MAVSMLKQQRVCVEAGANVLVAGSYLFSKPDYAAAIKTLVD